MGGAIPLHREKSGNDEFASVNTVPQISSADPLAEYLHEGAVGESVAAAEQRKTVSMSDLIRLALPGSSAAGYALNPKPSVEQH